MSQVDLEALERLLGEGTKGLWMPYSQRAEREAVVRVQGCTILFAPEEEGGIDSEKGRNNQADHNVCLAAGAVNALPALLEEVRAGRRALADERQQVADARQQLYDTNEAHNDIVAENTRIREERDVYGAENALLREALEKAVKAQHYVQPDMMTGDDPIEGFEMCLSCAFESWPCEDRACWVYQARAALASPSVPTQEKVQEAQEAGADAPAPPMTEAERYARSTEAKFSPQANAGSHPVALGQKVWSGMIQPTAESLAAANAWPAAPAAGPLAPPVLGAAQCETPYRCRIGHHEFCPAAPEKAALKEGASRPEEEAHEPGHEPIRDVGGSGERRGAEVAAVVEAERRAGPGALDRAHAGRAGGREGLHVQGGLHQRDDAGARTRQDSDLGRSEVAPCHLAEGPPSAAAAPAPGDADRVRLAITGGDCEHLQTCGCMESALVDLVARVRSEERERCAKVCDAIAVRVGAPNYSTAAEAARTIRASDATSAGGGE